MRAISNLNKISDAEHLTNWLYYDARMAIKNRGRKIHPSDKKIWSLLMKNDYPQPDGFEIQLTRQEYEEAMKKLLPLPRTLSPAFLAGLQIQRDW